MNIVLWVFQILLALHTVIGAVWKFSHSAAETMPSLSVISQPAWLALSGFELLCSLALVLPVVNKRLGKLIVLAAAGIVMEMILSSLLRRYQLRSHLLLVDSGLTLRLHCIW